METLAYVAREVGMAIAEFGAILMFMAFVALLAGAATGVL